MKLKLPFLSKSSVDDFEAFDESLSLEDRPSLFARLLGHGDGEDHFGEEGGGGGGLLLFGGGLLIIGLVGAVIGYFVIGGDPEPDPADGKPSLLADGGAPGDEDTETPHGRGGTPDVHKPDSHKPASPPDTPSDPPGENHDTNGPPAQDGGLVLASAAMPPRPVVVDPVLATNQDCIRRPWLETCKNDAVVKVPDHPPSPVPAPAGVDPPGVVPTAPKAAPQSEPPPAPPQAAASLASAGAAGGDEPLHPDPLTKGEAPSFQKLPASKPSPLAPAPQPQLVGAGTAGALPVIGGDGTRALAAYARPFNTQDKRPRIAIILTNLGLRQEATSAAIERTPADVTLAFSPYGFNLQSWTDKARAAGHETLMVVPMESNLPGHDPGPMGLVTALSPEENQSRMETVLARAGGYVGVIPTRGSKFLAGPTHILPVVVALKNRGLLFVDNGTAGPASALADGAPAGVVHSQVDVALDERGFAASIDARLEQLVTLAHTNRRAIGVASATPLMLARLAEWVPTLDRKKVTLSPVSAVSRTAKPPT